MSSFKKIVASSLEPFHLRMPVFNTIVKLSQDKAITKLKEIANNSDQNIMVNSSPKRILFNLVRGMYATPIYIEAGLALALKLRGHNVRLLTCGGALSECPGYFVIGKPPNKWSCNNCKQFSKEFFGIVDLPHSTYAEYVDEGKLSNVKDKINKMSIEDCENFVYKNINVGIHAFTSTQRYFKGANPDKSTYEKIYYLELINAIISTIVAENVLKKEKPDILVTSHSCYSPWGSFSDYFRNKGIRVCTYGRGYKINTLRFDQNNLGENFKKYIETVRNKKFLDKNEEKELKSFMDKRIKGQEGDTFLYGFSDFEKNIKKQFDLDKYNKTCALFPNVPWDASLIDANKAFKNVYEWISYTIELLKEKPELQLIIKIHPAEKISESVNTVLDYINNNFKPIPKNIKVIPPDTKISSYSLFPIIDVGIVYNGTLGLEMALNNIPVIVAGQTHYDYNGFTYDISSKKGYHDILLSNISPLSEKQLKTAQIYAYFYFIKNFVPQNYFYYNNFLDLGWNITSLEELVSNEDKCLDHVCNYIVHGGIYQNW